MKNVSAHRGHARPGAQTPGLAVIPTIPTVPEAKSAPATRVGQSAQPVSALESGIVHYTFRQLVCAAQLEGRGARCRPRPHDLRHSFAVRTLLAWYRAGVDVEAQLPLLSTHLGHIKPASTYWYVSSSPELMALAAQRLQDHVDRAGGASRAGQS